MSQDYYDRLGNLLRDRLNSDEDPFDSWDPSMGRHRKAGNQKERTAPQATATSPKVSVPTELLEDFKTLKVLPGASMQECKNAWKHLLMEYHPDKNSDSPENLQKANEISVRVTESWRKIALWFKTGKIT